MRYFSFEPSVEVVVEWSADEEEDIGSFSAVTEKEIERERQGERQRGYVSVPRTRNTPSTIYGIWYRRVMGKQTKSEPLISEKSPMETSPMPTTALCFR